GVTGKVWLVVNVLYGAIRHLLPFVAGLFVLASAFGFAFHRWLEAPLKRTGPMHWNVVFWNLYLAAGLMAVAALFLTIRQFVQSSRRPSGAAMAALQGLVLLF